MLTLFGSGQRGPKVGEAEQQLKLQIQGKEAEILVLPLLTSKVTWQIAYLSGKPVFLKYQLLLRIVVRVNQSSPWVAVG